MARLIVEEQFRGNYRLESARITTQQNLVADCLSRLGQPGKWLEFSAACENANVSPTRVELPPEAFSLSSRFSEAV